MSITFTGSYNFAGQVTGFKSYTAPTSPLQGTVAGYVLGGMTTAIQKFPFASDNGLQVGTLPDSRYGGGGQSSETNGYVSGTSNSQTINKFPYSSSVTVTSPGSLTGTQAYFFAGQSSTDYGYNSGGYDNASTLSLARRDRFPFATDASATNIVDTTNTHREGAGGSSPTHGYISGGLGVGNIEKWPFASDATIVAVGSLTGTQRRTAGVSSSTNGYVAGSGSTPASSILQKFPFATDAAATSLGATLHSSQWMSGSASFDAGYLAGGYDYTVPGTASARWVDKFTFASDTLGVSHGGSLQIGTYGAAGVQD